MTNNKYYVEEIWIELNYKKGFSERKINFPITNKEKYKAAPWVKEYQFFDIEKKENISPLIINPNYNIAYILDDQHKMIIENDIKLEMLHFVKEITYELNQITKKRIKKEKINQINKKENYIPSNDIEQYKFIDFLKVNIDQETKIYEIPTNNSCIYINKSNIKEKENKINK